MNQNKGMSLVEVMIVAGMLGGMALVGMRLMENQQKSASYFEMKNEEASVIRSIQLTLTDKLACGETLKDHKIGDSFEAIKNKNKKDIFMVGKIIGRNLIKIKSLSTKNNDIPEEGGTGSLFVNIELERLRKGYGGKSTTKELMIQATVDPSGIVTSCYTDQDATVLAAKRETCLMLGGELNEEKGNCEITSTDENSVATKKYIEDRLQLFMLQVEDKIVKSIGSGASKADSSNILSQLPTLFSTKNAQSCQGSAIRYRYKDAVSSSCEKELQYRTCTNGTWGDWSGTFVNINCTEN